MKKFFNIEYMLMFLIIFFVSGSFSWYMFSEFFLATLFMIVGMGLATYREVLKLREEKVTGQ